MGAVAAVTFVPQLLVYKRLNGNFRPSPEVSDKLHWNAPNALRVLFDPAHGLYFWAPILLLATIGIWFVIRRDPRLGMSLATGFLLTLYLNGAFQTWTTAGSFGARRFIVCTPLFAVGLAEIFSRFGERSERAIPTVRAWVPVLVALVILWNCGLMVQFVKQYMDRQQLEWPLVIVNQFTRCRAISRATSGGSCAIPARSTRGAGHDDLAACTGDGGALRRRLFRCRSGRNRTRKSFGSTRASSRSAVSPSTPTRRCSTRRAERRRGCASSSSVPAPSSVWISRPPPCAPPARCCRMRTWCRRRSTTLCPSRREPSI